MYLLEINDLTNGHLQVSCTGESSLGGLYHDNARRYAPLIGRFLQADSVVPRDYAQHLYARIITRPFYSGNMTMQQIANKSTKRGVKIISFLLAVMGCILVAFLWAFLFWDTSPLNASRVTPAEPAADWFIAWLHDPVCQPPCWEGITPGVTTMEEAVRIIAQLPEVIIGDGPARPIPDIPELEMPFGFTTTDAATGQVTPNGGGRIVSDRDGEFVEYITLGPDGGAIKDVYDVYGPPEKVGVSSCNHYPYKADCVIGLYYPEYGMDVFQSSVVMDWMGNLTISRENGLYVIQLFSNQNDQYWDQFYNTDHLFPWEGFGKINVR